MATIICGAQPTSQHPIKQRPRPLYIYPLSTTSNPPQIYFATWVSKVKPSSNHLTKGSLFIGTEASSKPSLPDQSRPSTTRIDRLKKKKKLPWLLNFFKVKCSHTSPSESEMESVDNLMDRSFNVRQKNNELKKDGSIFSLLQVAIATHFIIYICFWENQRAIEAYL